MVIKIDIDGVIRDIITPMCELYNNLIEKNTNSCVYGHKYPTDVKYYDVEQSFELVKRYACMDTKEWFFDKNAKKLFLESKPFFGVKEAIDRLHNNGHKIVIVTWQLSYENKLYTLEFLEKNGIYYDDICFTKDKGMINGDMLIDDNPEFLDTQDENVIRVCINRPYNMDYENSHIRVNSLNDIANIIECVNFSVINKK